MRIAIVGCGALGTILGAYLTRSRYDIEMVDAYEAHVAALNATGARITGLTDLTVPVKAITPAQMTGTYDVIFLLTKQTANETILPHLTNYLSETGTVCTLQNGVPEMFVAQYIGPSRTVGGTVLWSATFVGPGESALMQDLLRTDHLFEIGEIDGAVTPRIEQVAGILRGMGPTNVTDRLMQSRWSKLINNACMSGMSAVCGGTFGDVLDNDTARACLSYLGNEVKRCSEAEGYPLPLLLGVYEPDSLTLSDQPMFDRSQQMFLTMYDPARPAKASMLQDLEKGNVTEVRMINGYVCQVGDKHGIDTPFNDKVVELVTKIERGELPPSMENLQHFDPAMFAYAPYQTE